MVHRKKIGAQEQAGENQQKEEVSQEEEKTGKFGQ